MNNTKNKSRIIRAMIIDINKRDAYYRDKKKLIGEIISFDESTIRNLINDFISITNVKILTGPISAFYNKKITNGEIKRISCFVAIKIKNLTK